MKHRLLRRWIRTCVPAEKPVIKFNRALQVADSFCPHELNPEMLYDWLMSNGHEIEAVTLKLASIEVGYFQ